MSCEGCEEGAYVIDALAKLLAEIAVIVNGPEPPLTRWSYHDLPEKVRALKDARQPAAAVPDRERVAMAISHAVTANFDDKTWAEVRLIAADAAIAAMGETP